MNLDIKFYKMIDHITIKVSNLEKSKKFYEKVFDSMGWKVAFGEENEFWAFDIGNGLFEIVKADEKNITPVHVAFRVKNKEEVHKFYESGMKAGGKDNGKPEPCPEYTKDYYAGFILDFDGHNIEAMID